MLRVREKHAMRVIPLFVLSIPDSSGGRLSRT